MLNKDSASKMADNLLGQLRNELGLPNSLSRHLSQKKVMLVKNLEDVASYWIVVFTYRKQVLAFLRIDLEGQLLAYGTFGRGKSVSDFPPTSFFSKATAKMEIHNSFGDEYKKITSPELVHDGPRDRIAWMSKAEKEDGKKMLLFWTFGTVYSRSEEEKQKKYML